MKPLLSFLGLAFEQARYLAASAIENPIIDTILCVIGFLAFAAACGAALTLMP